jgi:glycerophosphoryl diester phosphodiesterase
LSSTHPSCPFVNPILNFGLWKLKALFFSSRENVTNHQSETTDTMLFVCLRIAIAISFHSFVAASMEGSRQVGALPIIFAHRGAGDSQLDNTLQAVLWAHSQGAAVELDVGLTKDKIPVLYHDPWVDQRPRSRGLFGNKDSSCCSMSPASFARDQKGSPSNKCKSAPETIHTNQQLTTLAYLRDLTFDELQQGSLAACAPGVTKLRTALNVLRDGTPVFLDLKIQEAFTAPASAFAKAILPLLCGHRGTVWVEVPKVEHAHAFRLQGFTSSDNRKLLLSWPPFQAHKAFTWILWRFTGVKTMLFTSMGAADPVSTLQNHQLDGIVTMAPVISSKVAQQVRAAGFLVAWFNLRQPATEQLDIVLELCFTGIADGIILDHLNSLACQNLPESQR